LIADDAAGNATDDQASIRFARAIGTTSRQYHWNKRNGD